MANTIYLDTDTCWMMMSITIDGNEKTYSFKNNIYISGFHTLFKTILTKKQYEDSFEQDFAGYISDKKYNDFIKELNNQIRIYSVDIEKLVR